MAQNIVAISDINLERKNRKKLCMTRLSLKKFIQSAKLSRIATKDLKNTRVTHFSTCK